MKRTLVNIRGCNGAGKSTVIFNMMDDPEMYVVYKNYKGKRKGICTVFPNYGWVALGTYFNKTGGLDVLPNNKFTEKVLWYVLKRFSEYDIVMEGIMASTIKSTYIALFGEIQLEYPELKIVIMSFTTPLELCLQRIYERNGGKPIKEEFVMRKRNSVIKGVTDFKKAGFISKGIDSSKIKKENMHLLLDKCKGVKDG